MLATFYNLTALLRLCEALTLSQELGYIVTNITQAANREQQQIHNIIYASNEDFTGQQQLQTNTLLRVLNTHSQRPVMNVLAELPIQRWLNNFNNNYLVVVRLDGQPEHDELLLDLLWQSMHQNMLNRLILMLDDTIDVTYVAQILHYSVAHEAMNVIALQPTRAVVHRSYWTIRIFPEPQVLELTLPSSYTATFLQHVGNMHGHALRVATTITYPRCYLMPNAQGHEQLSGKIGNIFVEYARRHNATIAYVFGEKEDVMFVDRLDDMVENGSADISCLATYENSDRNLSYTIAFDRHDWRVMVPVEKPLPAATFFFIIFDKATLLMSIFGFMMVSLALALSDRLQGCVISYRDLVFNVPIFQALLGQTFWMESRLLAARSAIYMGISVAGIIFSTTYCTYLQSFNMRAPTEPPVETVSDLVERGIKLLFHTDEVKLIKLPVDAFEAFHKYLPYVTQVNNMSEILNLRDNFDARYAYPISVAWKIIDEQQKFFKRPIFRLSGIRPSRSWPMVLSLRENSIHRLAFNALLGDINSAGLMAFWEKHAFIEMLQLHVLKLRDHSEKSDVEPMKLETLHIVLCLMAALDVLAGVCLLLEMSWANRKAIRGWLCVERKFDGAA